MESLVWRDRSWRLQQEQALPPLLLQGADVENLALLLRLQQKITLNRAAAVDYFLFTLLVHFLSLSNVRGKKRVKYPSHFHRAQSVFPMIQKAGNPHI